METEPELQQSCGCIRPPQQHAAVDGDTCIKVEKSFFSVTFITGHDPQDGPLGSVAHVSCRNRQAAQKQPVRLMTFHLHAHGNSRWMHTSGSEGGGRRRSELCSFTAHGEAARTSRFLQAGRSSVPDPPAGASPQAPDLSSLF